MGIKELLEAIKNPGSGIQVGPVFWGKQASYILQQHGQVFGSFQYASQHQDENQFELVPVVLGPNFGLDIAQVVYAAVTTPNGQGFELRPCYITEDRKFLDLGCRKTGRYEYCGLLFDVETILDWIKIRADKHEYLDLTQNPFSRERFQEKSLDDNFVRHLSKRKLPDELEPLMNQ